MNVHKGHSYHQKVFPYAEPLFQHRNVLLRYYSEAVDMLQPGERYSREKFGEVLSLLMEVWILYDGIKVCKNNQHVRRFFGFYHH